MDIPKLIKAIQGVVGTRTYLPIDSNESILVFERKGYIYIFRGLGSVCGSTSADYIATRIIELMQEDEYHPELLEKLNNV